MKTSLERRFSSTPHPHELTNQLNRFAQNLKDMFQERDAALTEAHKMLDTQTKQITDLLNRVAELESAH